MGDKPEIECPDCQGHGFIGRDEIRCEGCGGDGWRPMTDEERDDAAANAFSDMCESEPPVTMAEQHQRAWQQKQELR